VKVKQLFLGLIITSITTSAYAHQTSPDLNSITLEASLIGIQELSDDELDAVSGGNPLIPVVVSVADAAIISVGVYVGKQLVNKDPVTPVGVIQAGAFGAINGTVGAIAKASNAAIAAAPAITKVVNKSIEVITRIASGVTGTQVDKHPTPSCK
jgi:hypothetical protein